MDDTRNTPAEPTPLAYILRALGLLVGAIVDESGRTPGELAQIIGARADDLRAGLANPARLIASHVMCLAYMADISPADLFRDAELGARVIAAQVLDGRACRRCGRAFRIGVPSRPDGFGEHGQLFRCSRGWGCTLDEQVVDDEPAAAPRPGDRFAIRQELEDGTVGYEPVTVISVGAYVQADGVADTEMVGLVELAPIELADRTPVDIVAEEHRELDADATAALAAVSEPPTEDDNPFARALGYVAEIRAREDEQ